MDLNKTMKNRQKNQGNENKQTTQRPSDVNRNFQ